MTSSSGSGSSQTFSAQYSDPNGFADLTQVFFLMNTTVDPRNACYVRYDRSTNFMYLVDDAGTGLLGPLTPGSSASLQNSQCLLSGSGSSVVTSGITLTWNVALTFKAAFAGAKTIFLLARDSTSLESGWQARGSWTVVSAGAPTMWR